MRALSIRQPYAESIPSASSGQALRGIKTARVSQPLDADHWGAVSHLRGEGLGGGSTSSPQVEFDKLTAGRGQGSGKYKSRDLAVVVAGERLPVVQIRKGAERV